MTTRKQDVKETFDKASSLYDERAGFFFNYFGKELVKRAGELREKRVLDVATGRGAVLFPLLEAGARVDTIDISGEMVRLTEGEAKKRGLNEIRFHVMDAEKLAFEEGTFDAVLCGFGVFFCDSIEGVLREFRKVLKRGGIVAFSTWGDDLSMLNKWISQKSDELGKRKLVKERFSNPEEIKATLQRVGFKDITIEQETRPFYYASPEAWFDSVRAHGNRYFIEQLSDSELSDVRARAVEHASQFIKPQGVEDIKTVNYVVARK